MKYYNGLSSSTYSRFDEQFDLQAPNQYLLRPSISHRKNGKNNFHPIFIIFFPWQSSCALQSPTFTLLFQ